MNSQLREKHETCWHILTILVAGYTLLHVPMSFAYRNEVSQLDVIMDVLITLFFLFDFFVSFKKHPRQSKKIIFVRLLCCIPFDVLAYSFGGGVHIFRLVRAAKLFDLRMMFTNIGGVTVIPTRFKIFATIGGVLVFIHWSSCLWTVVSHYRQESVFDTHLNSIYWTITTLTTVGYGDITPTTNAAKIFTMFIMIIGIGIYGLVIGKFSSILTESNRHKEKSKEKIQSLTEFMHHYSIPRTLQTQTLEYYHKMLVKRLSDDDHQIISDLPQALQIELKLYMNVKLISGFVMFSKCSPRCLEAIAGSLQQKAYTPGQYIIKAGDIGQEMFIINQGQVRVVSKEGQDLITLQEGKFFGERALLEEAPRNADVIAENYCDLYILEKEHFLRFTKDFPELLRSMEESLTLMNTLGE